jgi:hypothetical protein
MTTVNPDLIPGNILPTDSDITFKTYWDHIQARLGIRRKKHRVASGLYTLGSPTADSPVFVSANYTLSFDALRSNLSGMDAYILVLNTHGINVWCAAGKGTFGTAEIIKQVSETGLRGIVKHRRMIVPQLGAPGVAAHEVKQATGFTVEYGPVRAADLPKYMKTHKATPEMRRVDFPLKDRMVLIPVEITLSLATFLIAAAVFYFLGGIRTALAVMTVMLAGLVLFPILLPWLPARDFSVKGFLLGILSAAPFAVSVFTQNSDWNWYRQAVHAVSFPLLMAPAIAFLALNFTGSSTFTSRLGVKREINQYIPIMAWTFGVGLVTMILGIFIR